MKRMTQLAAWGAVSAISFAMLTAPARGDDKSKTSSTASDYKKAAGTESFQSDKSFGQVEKVTKLIGKEVFTSDNQKFGKLDNLMLETGSGRILYAVVGSGGILGAG